MEGGQIHPLTLRFRTRELETEYWRRALPGIRQRTVIAVIIVVVLFTMFGFLDPWIIPEAVAPALAVRGAVTGLCLLVIGLTRTRLGDPFSHRTVPVSR